MIRQYLALLLLRAAARALWRLIKVAAVAAVIVAAAPVSVVAAAAAVTAWACGWPPRRLYGAALWCLPLLGVWLAASALSEPGSAGVARGPAWYRVVDAPYDAWLSMWVLARSGHVAAAAVAIAPAAVPLGLLAGGLAWAYRIYRMATGAGGLSPSSAISFDRRQWRRQVRSARARIAAPGAMPLTYRNGDVVIGGAIRAVRHSGKPITALPYPRLRSHQVVIGTTRDRQNDAAAAAVGRVHGHRPDPARGRDRTAAAAGGPGLQGRRGFPPGRGPGPPGAARRRRPRDRDLAR